jgi:hypothetical protein
MLTQIPNTNALLYTPTPPTPEEVRKAMAWVSISRDAIEHAEQNMKDAIRYFESNRSATWDDYRRAMAAQARLALAILRRARAQKADDGRDAA